MILLTLTHGDGRRVLIEREADRAAICVLYPAGHRDIQEIASRDDVLVRIIEDVRSAYPQPEWKEEDRG